MRRVQNIFLIFTIGLAASAIAADHKPQTPVIAHSHEHRLYNADDLTAIADMRAYAAKRYGAIADIPGTFGVSEEWDDVCIYRQLHFRLATGGSITICHAMDRHDHSIRYLATKDEQTGQYTRWEPAP